MGRNVIREYVDYSSKNLRLYTKRIMGQYYDSELFDKYLNEYINVRYYNLESWVRYDFDTHISYYLEKVYEKNNNNKSKFILDLFKLYYFIDDVYYFDYLENMDKYLDVISTIRFNKLGINDSAFRSEFRDLLINCQNKKENYIKIFNCDDFSLDVKKVYRDDIYNVVIKHNIKIPKIFSNYAINRVWNSKVISENKIQVLYYLVNQLILKDIISGNFQKKYLVSFAVSLFEKPDKLKSVLKIFDNDIAKNLVILKVKYALFIKYKDVFLEYINAGYQIAVIIDDVYLDEESNKSIIDICKYVIVDNDKYLVGDVKNKNNVIDLR